MARVLCCVIIKVIGATTRTDVASPIDYILITGKSIDKYFMMSHCQATLKLEHNGGLRAQLQVVTFVTSVKETLFYK